LSRFNLCEKAKRAQHGRVSLRGGEGGIRKVPSKHPAGVLPLRFTLQGQVARGRAAENKNTRKTRMLLKGGEGGIRNVPSMGARG